MLDFIPDFQTLFIYAIPILFAITLHEAAHGWVASLFGDNTAKMMGRVTLNPIKHIDPIGTILIPGILILTAAGFIFGWAKPVPINYNALKSPKKDMVWVALAGPAANIAMAIGWIIVFKFSLNISNPLYEMAQIGVFVNILLAVFNLLPIPPLDGSRIVSSLLPQTLSYKYNQLEPYGLYILLGLLFLGGFKNIVLPLVEFFIKWFFSIFTLIGF